MYAGKSEKRNGLNGLRPEFRQLFNGWAGARRKATRLKSWPICRKLAALLGDVPAEQLLKLCGCMRRLIKMGVLFALMASTGYALYRVGETTRITDRWHSPDPQTFRKQAWAELAARQLRPGMPVFIRIFKQSSQLELWLQAKSGWELYKTVEICNWSGGLGPKLKEGDRQSPEGFYTVTKAQLNPGSRHHLSFNLGFPNRYDRSLGRTGSFLMVHGGCSSSGCYAVRDHEVEVIYRLVEAALNNGQRAVGVHAFPFRLEQAALDRHKGSRWHDFWANLKNGYDVFEHLGQVPRVRIANKSYVVN